MHCGNAGFGYVKLVSQVVHEHQKLDGPHDWSPSSYAQTVTVASQQLCCVTDRKTQFSWGSEGRIVCAGHSLGSSLAALCTPYMKAIVPHASVNYLGSGSPVSFLFSCHN